MEILNIIFAVDGKYYALPCPHCGANTTRKGVKDGVPHPNMDGEAMKRHTSVAHRDIETHTLSTDEAVDMCKGDPISVRDLRRIVAGELAGKGELLEVKGVPTGGEEAATAFHNFIISLRLTTYFRHCEGQASSIR
jgi:hypothetical protein